jgi:hypothetical protein
MPRDWVEQSYNKSKDFLFYFGNAARLSVG